MSNPKKNPKKPLKAWEGIPSIDKEGWQYLFLFNPTTGEFAKVEIPKRYAFDKRGYPFPDYATNTKVSGVIWFSHKDENHWDAVVAKKNLDRLFSAGFVIIPPDHIRIVSSSDAKKFNPAYENRTGERKRGKRGQGDGEDGGDPGGIIVQFEFGEGDGDGDGGENNDQIKFKPTPNGGQIAAAPDGQTPRKAPAPKQNSEQKQAPTPTPTPAQSEKPKEEKPKDKNKGNQDGDKKDEEKDKNNQPNQSLPSQEQQPREYEQESKDTEKDDTPFESKGEGVNDDEISYDDKDGEEDLEAAREVARIAEEEERKGREKAKQAASGTSEPMPKAEAQEEKVHEKQPRSPRKHRGKRKRLGKRVVQVDRHAKGNSGDGSRVRGIYSYSEIVYNAQVYQASKKAAEVLSEFIGKSQVMLEYGIRSDIPQLLIRLESGDNPIPALEIPQQRPKMKIMISPDCSPSTHDWNGLACAWAIRLAKNPDLDILFCVNSNGEPVKISSERYLTLMRSSDIIIYLGDADGMSHNKEWARDYGQHVIALSSVQISIGVIPPIKVKEGKVHLVVQRYGRGILRYATGVSSKDPRTWVKALTLCLNSLEPS